MKLRLEIDIDEQSMIEDDDSDIDKSPFELRSEVAELRKEILATLTESGRWTVERGNAGIYYLASRDDKNKEASVGFKPAGAE